MVLALIPTQPCLLEYMPNFVNDMHGSWFRNAQYMFDNIRMPAAAALRGDPLAELIWHRYVADILHARMKCMNLLENQVIQHLSQKVHRENQQFFVHKRQQPTMSVLYATGLTEFPISTSVAVPSGRN